MGFLNRMFPGDTFDLTLSVDDGAVAPGGQVVARYELTGELDPKCTALLVRLSGTAFYRTTVHSTRPDGSTSSTTASVPYALHDEQRQHDLAIGPGQSVFALPGWAPPSSQGSVSWTVYAQVVRERGSDEEQEADVVVRLPGGDGLPTERAPQGAEDGLVIEAPAVAAALGETVTGTVAITLIEDARAKSLTVSLQRRTVTLTSQADSGSVLPDGPLATTEYSNGVGSTMAGLMGGEVDEIGAWVPVASIEVPIDRDLVAGSLERVPFSLDVPAGAGPTTAHRAGRVEWRIAANLDRKGAFKGDLEGAAPLFVY